MRAQQRPLSGPIGNWAGVRRAPRRTVPLAGMSASTRLTAEGAGGREISLDRRGVLPQADRKGSVPLTRLPGRHRPARRLIATCAAGRWSQLTSSGLARNLRRAVVTVVVLHEAAAIGE